MPRWFIVQIDRDFITGYYGNGYRLYQDRIPDYRLIKGIKYLNGDLIVSDGNNNITLTEEPSIDMFNNILHNEWAIWDKKYGSIYEEDRCDYEPCVAKTKKETAEWLNLV